MIITGRPSRRAIPADDGFVIAPERDRPLQLIKLIKRQTNIIRGVRTLPVGAPVRLTLRFMRRIGEDFARQFCTLFSRRRWTSSSILYQFLIGGLPQSGIDFRFRLCYRLFKIKEIQTHNYSVVKLQFTCSEPMRPRRSLSKRSLGETRHVA